jgi:hypothetical protein
MCPRDSPDCGTHLADGVDVDVVLGLLGVGHERLNEESPQVTLDVLDLLQLVCALGNPLLGLGPGSVQLEQTGLASPLDELIGLCDELGTGRKGNVASAASRTPWMLSPSLNVMEASFAGGLWVACAGRGVGLITGARVRW